MFSCLVFLAVFAAVQGRAVNISNTWVLPEEGFPVFYRYFRDRISWYEADAVCQFHHANLVTVDTTAQYDAVRAYLKELDITSAVWVGLIRSNPDGEFTWTDYRGLSGDGYWSSAPDARTAPLCAAADPSADYRWEARACGGPTVASFICELPVPQWALGKAGCMVRNIPALTVLYLPESAAVQLTADCGLAGVKRIQCTGNVEREALLKDLACIVEETTTSVVRIETTDVTTSRDNVNDIITEDDTVSTSEKITQPTSTHTALKDIIITTPEATPISNEDNKVYMTKTINIDFINHNNIQSNDIPRIAGNANDFMEEQIAKSEDEKLRQEILLHEHIARHGSFDSSDHFVPPLVMAKAKISNDMTVISLQEKHAQQLANQGVLNYQNTHKEVIPLEKEIASGSTTDKELAKNTKYPNKNIELTNNVKKDVKFKSYVPKKYNEKYISIKGKYTNPLENKKENSYDANLETFSSSSQPTTHIMEPITTMKISDFHKFTTDVNPIDLTVIFKEPAINKNLPFKPTISEMTQTTDHYQTHTPRTEISSTEVITDKNVQTTSESQTNNYNFNDEIIKITVIKGADDPSPFTTKVFEITTKVPVIKNDISTMSSNITESEKETTDASSSNTELDFTITSIKNDVATTPNPTSKIENVQTTPKIESVTSVKPISINISNSQVNLLDGTNITSDVNDSTILPDGGIYNTTDVFNTPEADTSHETESLNEPIDDANSPLLSGASEPLHRPPRLRRPQQQNNMKKFNPFRILG